MRSTVIINTINEEKDVLIRSVESYINQFDQVIISTIEGDTSIGLFHEVEYAVVAKSEHVGKSASGAYQQLNNALKFFKTDFLCYASGNDYAEPDKAAIEIDCLRSSGNKVCNSAFYVVKDGVKTYQPLHNYDYNIHLKNNFISDCSMISRDMVEKYLPYNIHYKNYAHWDSWLRMFKGEGDIFHYNPLPTWNYMHNENDMSKARMRDPEKIRQNLADRETMLNDHR